MNDLISRKVAIGAVVDELKKIPTSAIRAKTRLESLPPARQWIPVSERLPDSSKQVLVYARSVHYALAKYDEMREADGSYKKQWVTFDAWKPFYTIKDVIAWMPLPEPLEPLMERSRE